MDELRRRINKCIANNGNKRDDITIHSTSTYETPRKIAQFAQMHLTNCMQWAHLQKEESPEFIQNEGWVQLSGRAAAYRAGRVEVQSPATQT